MFILSVYTLILLGVVLVECSENYETNLKNITEMSNKPRHKKDDDVVKKEIKKYLRECGANVSEEEEDEETGQDDNRNNRQQKTRWSNNDDDNGQNKKKNRGTYPLNYGTKTDYSDEEPYEQKGNRRMYRDTSLLESFDMSQTFENYRDRNNNNNNRRSNKRKQQQDDYDYNSDDDSCSEHKNRNNNNKRNRNRGGGYDNNYNRGNGYSNNNGYNKRNQGYNGNEQYGTRYGEYDEFGGGGYIGWPRRIGRLRKNDDTESGSRIKRNSEKNDSDDVQCLSQCVFGYLEMLDDNRLPAETEVVKFLQNNISDTQKRLRTVRQARRCFAKLSSEDTEDGCSFSKELSKCLKLGIED